MPDQLSRLAAAVRTGATTSRSLVERALAREASARALNAVTSVTAAEALATADAIDAAARAGAPLGPLAGVPLLVKDNICTTDGVTTCASRMLPGYRSPFDAEAVRRLRQAGAVIVGKANMDEFAMGSTGETSAAGPCGNPWSAAHVPGGSSSGSAAAVAAGIVPASLGSDTGGSVRQPAAFCGVVGVKPTYGTVSRRGLVAYGSSLDQIGPLATSVADAALLLSVIAGHDAGDATSAAQPTPDYLGGLTAGVQGLRVGVPRALLASGVEPAVLAEVERAAAILEEAGARVVDVALPHAPVAAPAYYILATAEASSNLSRFDGVRYGHRTGDAADIDELYARSRAEGFGPEVIQRILLGTYVLSAGYYDAYYRKAQQVRTLIIDDYRAVFAACDVLLTPPSPSTAFRTGDASRDPLQMYLADIFTVSANLAGIPAMSLPMGLDGQGLPTAVQLSARAFREPVLFQAAAELERRRGALPSAPGYTLFDGADA